MTTKTLGIDIGSTSLKLCLLSAAPEDAVEQAMQPHDGDLEGTLRRLFTQMGIEPGAPIQGLVTGTEGRRRIELPEVIAAVAIESALAALKLTPRAVVSMGGEDLVVYVLNRQGRIVNTYSGNKCASGTGEFSAPAAGPDELEARTDQRHLRGRPCPPHIRPMLGVHEVGLHPPAQQGRGNQS